jgi:hypothetical protein
MADDSQVSWKVWAVISIITAGITPMAIELVPPIASAIARHWRPCTASVSQPSTPLTLYQQPEGQQVGSLGARQEQVTVVAEREGWYRVSAPEKGWVRGDRISAACLEQL